MSESQTPAPRSAGGRKRRHTEAGPVVVAGVEMPGVEGRSTIPKALYGALLNDFQSFDQRLQFGKAAMKEKVAEAKNRPDGPPILQATSRYDWTPELEMQAKKHLENTRSSWPISSALRCEYLNLTRTTMLHAACSPRDIVGVKTRLVYCRDYERFPQYAPDPFSKWTSSFCEKLSRLVTHPAWSTGTPAGRVYFLALAIQYAVILRTADKREWKMDVKDRFMELIQSYTNIGLPARTAHAKARWTLLQRHACDVHVYHISNVFTALEKNVMEKPQTVDSGSFYNVTTEDLCNLIDALDSMTDPDTGNHFLSTEVHFKMALAIRPTHDLFPTASDLDSVHEQVMMEESRRLVHLEYLCSRPLVGAHGDAVSHGNAVSHGDLESVFSGMHLNDLPENPLQDPDVFDNTPQEVEPEAAATENEERAAGRQEAERQAAAKKEAEQQAAEKEAERQAAVEEADRQAAVKEAEQQAAARHQAECDQAELDAATQEANRVEQAEAEVQYDWVEEGRSNFVDWEAATTPDKSGIWLSEGYYNIFRTGFTEPYK